MDMQGEVRRLHGYMRWALRLSCYSLGSLRRDRSLPWVHQETNEHQIAPGVLQRFEVWGRDKVHKRLLNYAIRGQRGDCSETRRALSGGRGWSGSNNDSRVGREGGRDPAYGSSCQSSPKASLPLLQRIADWWRRTYAIKILISRKNEDSSVGSASLT